MVASILRSDQKSKRLRVVLERIEGLVPLLWRCLPNGLQRILQKTTVLHWAFAISLGFHACLLFIKFGVPVIERIWESQNPIVAILVNTQTQEAPLDALAIAQANLDSGGTSDQKLMASSPLEPSEKRTNGALEVVQERSGEAVREEKNQEKRAKLQMMLAQIKKNEQILTQLDSTQWSEEQKAHRKLQMDLAAKIEKKIQELSERPKKLYLGARAKYEEEALWVEGWQNKLEFVGNQLYEGGGYNVEGQVILTLSMDATGSLLGIKIEKGSGVAALDELAIAIAKRAAPFEPFDIKLQQKADILYITRLWNFKKGFGLNSMPE